MIELLSDMPAGVAGISVSGKLSRDDLAVVPTLEDAFKGDEFRLVEVINDDYAGFGHGGLVEDMRVGFGALIKHHAQFKRIAIVTNLNWATHTIHALAWMIPGEMKTFTLDELDQAKEWAAS